MKKSSISKVALENKNSEGTKYGEVFSNGDVLLLLSNVADPFTTLAISEGEGTTSAKFVEFGRAFVKKHVRRRILRLKQFCRLC